TTLLLETMTGSWLGVQHGRVHSEGRRHALPILARLLVGVCLVQVGFALALRGHLGTGPFNVLQQGVAARLGWSIGHAGWLNGAVLVLLALWLGQRPGVATVTTVVLGGLVLDATLPRIGSPPWLAAQLAMTTVGLGLMCAGGALYLSARL